MAERALTFGFGGYACSCAASTMAWHTSGGPQRRLGRTGRTSIADEGRG
jgi:hypothetical protein